MVQYWLRVHGYPTDLKDEVVYYSDFYDPFRGRLPGDVRQHLRTGDVVIFYADGPASLYALGTVAGDVEGPFPEVGRGPRWTIPISPQAVITDLAKAPHAGGLMPPSGWHFLRAVRDYTFIRLPDVDGPYLADQVRARAGRRAE